jgi:Uma2 family endonuclease
LGVDLGGPFDRGRGGPGGWWILDEPELHPDCDVLVPDLAGWCRERLTRLPDEAFFSLAPDWICEVVSASTSAIDRVKKLRVYARESVRHAWLIDPLARTLEVFRLEDGRWTLMTAASGAEVLRVEPFDAIEFDLALLWAD